jgi:photosystem II stability/assembly factor-like uncharacterized protein
MSGTLESLHNVPFIDEQIVWVVGAGGTNLKTMDGGGSD